MARATPSARGPALLLTFVGLLLVPIGVAGIVAGLALAERIHALLPPITADADAVGGAALALGAASLLAAAVHLAEGIALRRRVGMPRESLLVSGIALCAVMSVLALGWSVAALVSAASGSAPPAAMLPAGIGLVLLSGAYLWAAGVLMRMRNRAPGAN